MTENTTKEGAVIIEAIVAIVIIIGVVFGIYNLDIISWQGSEQVVSGIVYDARFDEVLGGNTRFKVRASAEMAVTEETSPTYCLPPDSEYIDIVRKAAEDKSIKVVVRVHKRQPHRRKTFWGCDDNTEVEIFKENDK